MVQEASPPPLVADVLHTERLWPSATTWLVVPLFTGLCAAVGAAFGARGALVGALVGLIATVAALLNASARIEVSHAGGLRAGRARVPGGFLDGGRAATGPAARALRGTELDARTHLCLRGWVDGVVLVYLEDPDDPTPSWLVSTRHPQALLDAVEAVGMKDDPPPTPPGGWTRKRRSPRSDRGPPQVEARDHAEARGGRGRGERPLQPGVGARLRPRTRSRRAGRRSSWPAGCGGGRGSSCCR